MRYEAEQFEMPFIGLFQGEFPFCYDLRTWCGRDPFAWFSWWLVLRVESFQPRPVTFTHARRLVDELHQKEPAA